MLHRRQRGVMRHQRAHQPAGFAHGLQHHEIFHAIQCGGVDGAIARHAVRGQAGHHLADFFQCRIRRRVGNHRTVLGNQKSIAVARQLGGGDFFHHALEGDIAASHRHQLAIAAQALGKGDDRLLGGGVNIRRRGNRAFGGGSGHIPGPHGGVVAGRHQGGFAELGHGLVRLADIHIVKTTGFQRLIQHRLELAMAKARQHRADHALARMHPLVDEGHLVGGGGGKILLHAGFGGGIGVLIGHRGQHGGQYSHHQQYKKTRRWRSEFIMMSRFLVRTVGALFYLGVVSENGK